MRPFESRLLRVLPGTRRAVLLLGALGVAGGVLAIAQAFVLALLVVDAVRGRDVVEPAMWTLGVLCARGGVAAVTQLVADRSGDEVAAQVRSLVIRRWLRQPQDDRPSPARMLTGATSGASSIEPYVARYLPALVTAAVLPPVAIVALLWTDWPSALIVILTVPLLPVFAALIGRHTEESTRKRWSALTVLSGHFLDVMRGLPTLAAYQRAEAQVDVVDDVGQKHRRATVQTLRIAFLSSAALELLATIAVAMVAVCVGLRLAWGTMPLQVALTAILLTPEAYWPIRRVGQEFHAAADGAAALDDLLPREVTPVHPRSNIRALDTSVPCTREVSCVHPRSRSRALVAGVGTDSWHGIPAEVELTYRHPGSDRCTLQQLRVPLTRGLTALIGPSGSGKTTALEVLAGLRRSEEGPAVTPRYGVHLVGQRPFIAPTTLRENLLLGASDASDHELVEAMQLTGLHAVLTESRLGCTEATSRVHASDVSDARMSLLGMRLGDEGFGLSAGQRALVALTRAAVSSCASASSPASVTTRAAACSRAAVSDPPVLLLDEPTAHLDESVAGHVRRVISHMSEDRIVIVATHDPALMRAADRIVSLEGAGV